MPTSIANLESLIREYGALAPTTAGKAAAEGQGAYLPMHLLRRAIIRSWLGWHAGEEFGATSSKMAESLRRAYEYYRLNGDYPGARAFHDSFLIQCAILSGDAGLAAEAADFVEPALPGSADEVGTQCWTGILKYHVLADPAAMRRQYDRMAGSSPARVFVTPGPALVTAFVSGRPDVFRRALKKAVDRHARLASKAGALAKAEDGSIVFDARRMGDRYLWPWADAAFAKLAHRRGWEIAGDEFWIPARYVAATAH